MSATDFAFYEWSGRTIEFHRGQIRRALGFRECGVADADKLTEWLVVNVTQAERSPERVRDELLVRCREERIEPPSDGRIDRMVRSALHRGEELLFSEVAARLPEPVRARLVALVEAVDDGDDIEDDDGSVVLALIRSDPGNVSLNTMLTEISKLEAVRAIGLPVGVFADIAPKVVAAWRGRAAVESTSHLRDRPLEVTLPLLAALLYCREREITDTLVELLISTVHRINARAEVKVPKELIKEFQRVTGKENLLFRVAEATVDAGDRLVRDTVVPVAPQRVLRDLVAEFKSSGPTYQRTVKATLRASYTNHYRAGLIKLLDVLEFRSNNTDPGADGPEARTLRTDTRRFAVPPGAGRGGLDGGALRWPAGARAVGWCGLGHRSQLGVPHRVSGLPARSARERQLRQAPYHPRAAGTPGAANPRDGCRVRAHADR